MNKWVTSGLLFLLGVALALSVSAPARADGASYLGPTVCMGCHQAMNAPQIKGWQESPHSRAFWKTDESDATRKVVADLTKAPFPKDQVAWIQGSGARSQAYLDKDFKVLPNRWVVKTSSWQPQDAVDAKKDCLGCHTTGYNPTAATWVAEGVGCEMCHGPGSTHSGSADKKGTIVHVEQLPPDRRAMVCGRCHSQGKTPDGAYTFAADFAPGDDLDKVFAVKQDVPKGAMNGQYNELRFGGGKHFANGVVCTTCHDPHATTGVDHELRKPVPDLCMDEKCHGGGKLKAPPHTEQVIKSVSCVMCHMPNESHAFVTPKAG